MFWGFACLLIFTFAGYQALMQVWSKRRGNHSLPGLKAVAPLSNTEKQESVPQFLSIVLVVANEEKRIAARIENLLASDWDLERLELIVVSDGSEDRTPEIVEELAVARPNIKLLRLSSRQGKANGLNQGIAMAKGEVIIFADARQHFPTDTIPRLVKALEASGVGAVSGRLVVGGGGSAVGQGVGSYWEMETRLRHAESQVDSCIGCTGAVYALRKELFRPIPPDTLLDDVVIPMQVVLQGWRVLYEPDALAHDPQDLDPVREHIRKKRTLAGNFQMLFRYPGWLFPWRDRLWFQLLFHKYFRLAGPFLLMGILASSWMLRAEPFYGICLWGQLALYTLAMAGLLVPGLKVKVFTLPAGFLFLNWMVLLGFVHYLRAPKTGAWEMSARN